MPSLIRPGTVKVLTQDGEIQVSITLELNINLNSDGLSGNIAGAKIEKIEKSLEDNTEWAIPDFSSTKINFGK